MIVNNYLNYIGSKDRYLPQILKFIEKGASLTGGTHLVDLFCGSAVVGLNAAKYFKDVRCVDACKEVITLHKWVQETDNSEQLLAMVDNLIAVKGLSKENKDAYLKLREEYNELAVNNHAISPLMLYGLITHSFNYSLHTNKKGGYNVPFGSNRSSFNKKLRQKLKNWKDYLDTTNNIEFVCSDFRDIIRSEKTVFFVDPPYSASISKHPYRVGNIKWGAEEDRMLMKYLEYVDNEDNLFVFTNVIENNGVINTALAYWITDNGFHVTPVNIDYDNCNYQRKNNGKAKEVIITNFKL